MRDQPRAKHNGIGRCGHRQHESARSANANNQHHDLFGHAHFLGHAGKYRHQQGGGSGIAGEFGQENDKGGDGHNHDKRMGQHKSAGHFMTERGGRAGFLQQLAQRNAAAKQQQHAPVGIARHFAPAHHAKNHHGHCRAQGNKSIRAVNAKFLFQLAAKYPCHGGGGKNQHGNHAMQRPRNLFIGYFNPLRQIGFQNHEQRNQHQGQQHQHHGQAEFHPAGKIQIQGFGGNGVGRRAHHSAQPANAGAISDAKQHKNKSVAVFVLVHMVHQAHCQRQHHGGGGGIADPHG